METPLYVAICEDSREDAEKLLNVLAACSVPNVPKVFASGEELLAAYEPQHFDLLLSDIYMTGMTGVEAVGNIRRIDQDIPIAFITSSAEFALESYRLSALKYIEKPFQKKDIEEILGLARMKRDSAPSLTVQQGGKETGIRFSRIYYLEQQTHQLSIVTADGTVTVYERLSALVPQLEAAGFFTPHKSYCVNLAHVCGVDAELRCFQMPDGSNVPIRRETMKKAQKAFEEFLFRKTREETL